MTNMQMYSGKCTQAKVHLLFFHVFNSNSAISKSSIGLITPSNNLRPYRNPDSRQPNNELSWLRESCTVIGQGSHPALCDPIRTHHTRKHSPPPFSPILSPHQFSNFPAPSRLAITRSISSLLSQRTSSSKGAINGSIPSRNTRLTRSSHPPNPSFFNMTKKTFTSKPPRYQETPSEPDTSLPPPPYTAQETTPLISGGPSYAGSSYAPSGPSYTGPSYTASSRISDNSSTPGSLPSHFPRRNRTLRHAFRELRRDYLLATYHRALDAVAARGWRPPTLHWPGSSRSQRSSECGHEVDCGRRRERVRVWVKGVRRWGRVGEEKRRKRRRVILCCNLLIWVLVALGIAVFISGRWANEGGDRWPAPPERKETVRIGIIGKCCFLSMLGYILDEGNEKDEHKFRFLVEWK